MTISYSIYSIFLFPIYFLCLCHNSPTKTYDKPNKPTPLCLLDFLLTNSTNFLIIYSIFILFPSLTQFSPNFTHPIQITISLSFQKPKLNFSSFFHYKFEFPCPNTDLSLGATGFLTSYDVSNSNILGGKSMAYDNFELFFKANQNRIHYQIHRLNVRYDWRDEFFTEGIVALWTAYQ